MTENTQQVLDTLQAAGLAPQPVTVSDIDMRYYKVDRALGGKPPAVKFAGPGDLVTGVIMDMFAVEATEFGKPDIPKLGRDGEVVIDPVIVLRTDAGVQSLYVSSWRMKRAISEALWQAGVTGPRPGATLLVRFTGTEVIPGGAQPAKNYEAAYELPRGSQVRKLDEWLPGPDMAVAAPQPDDPPF